MWQWKQNWTKNCSLVGAHFLMAPFSFLWNYGNLSAYMESYFQVYCAPDCVDGDSQWILNLYLAAGCPGLFLSWFMLKKIGPKRAGTIIMLVTNVSLIASSWTVQKSIVGTSVLMGAVSGLGLGPTVCIGFMYINGWAGKNSGLLIGTATSAPTILSIAQNQIITAYVNPKNLKADTLIGVRAYFSQREILERVPEIILILGCMGLGLQIIGYLLITNPPTVSDPTLNGKDNDVDKHPENGKENISQNISDPKSLLVNRNEPAKHYDANPIKDDNGKTSANSEGEIFQENNHTNHVESHSKYHNVRSLKPSETLRSSNFYAMWLYGAAVGFGLILKNNYYKQFGLIYINNDVFLTLVGSLIPVFASATRIILGACIDRDILSIQDCLVMSLAANTFLCAFWFFAPQVSAILYMVLILALACAHSMVHTIVGTGVSKLFGNEHYFLNYGLVYSSGFLIAIVSALVVSPLREALGWFWLFASCSILGIFSLLYIAFYDLCFKTK